MDHFPVFYSVKGRSVIVFGGGAEAAAKLRLVQKTSANIVVIAEAFEPGVIDLAGTTPVLADPLAALLPDNVALAYAATGDAAKDAAIARRLRTLNITVCAADQPDVSDFITPAIVDRDPVIVAIGTEGTAPVLAREIKARVERMLPSGLGRIARKAGALREHVAGRFAPGGARRKFWHALFAPALDGAFERTGFGRAARELLAANDTPEQGFVSFVGAGAGGADLLTERARQRIDRADVVLHDALVAPEILELARREAILVNVGKRAGRHQMRQDEINETILHYVREGHRVVRLKGGDPAIFGRLAEELDAVGAEGFGFEIVPGVTAASVAAASALAPLTERGQAQELRIVTAHGAGGEDDVDAVDWAAAGASTSPIAIYMGRRAAPRVEARLLTGGRDPATPIILVESAGRAEEVRVHATLATMSSAVGTLPGTGPLMILLAMRSREIAHPAETRAPGAVRTPKSLLQLEAA
ncbi:siroheme synthase CysG [Acuticoccus sp. MNP-M23]|uniref:siroheme synthase CysG n=1 Tax=Acuticoccus sp. MNP-M23 TaxID=3072793 RepID=UPI002815BB5F|nr:siroheme synthase CysG [Acuticoccus sp. MNP-M23]WMS43998.1 siroheme synthase CysG [Acuticoccus sp. MNP-M23]